MWAPISVHLPKNGRTELLSVAAGAPWRPLSGYYGDHAICKPANVRCQEAFLAGVSMAKQELTGIECVNTHFLPVKYWALARKRELTIATWLREAVARLIPHFDYWQRRSTT